MKRFFLLFVIAAISLYAVDFNSYETDEAKRKYKNNYFGMEPHYPNYLLPFGITSKPYKSYILSDEYKKYEAELQVSLKLKITDNIFGFDERYYFAYTHKAMWQVYAESSPFRETNYNPEFFIVLPVYTSSLESLKKVQLSISHISNGQGDNRNIEYPEGIKNPGHRSRSMNFLEFMAFFEYKNLYTDIKLWTPYRHNQNLKDNDDIMDYYGYASAKLTYFYGKNMATLMGRVNPATGKGAIESTYSYPLDMYDDTYLFIKGFSGYGETLIDYNNYISKISIGISFSR